MKLFLNLFQFVFGCRHHHLSRVFTIKHRTYKVCFDCGREFDLPDPEVPSRTSIRMTSQVLREAAIPAKPELTGHLRQAS
jgi:hypothetical protein